MFIFEVVSYKSFTFEAIFGQWPAGFMLLKLFGKCLPNREQKGFMLGKLFLKMWPRSSLHVASVHIENENHTCICAYLRKTCYVCYLPYGLISAQARLTWKLGMMRKPNQEAIQVTQETVGGPQTWPPSCRKLR